MLFVLQGKRAVPGPPPNPLPVEESFSPGSDVLFLLAALLFIVGFVSAFIMKRYNVHKVNSFPKFWAFALGCGALALGICFACLLSGRWTPNEFTGPLVGLGALSVLLVAALPLIHRKSGYKPAEATITLSGWHGEQKRLEAIQVLRDYLVQEGFVPLDPAEWKWDVVVKKNFAGTVDSTQGVPHLMLARFTAVPEGTKVELMADNMGIMISDTGETENCKNLLVYMAACFTQPPFAEAPDPAEQPQYGEAPSTGTAEPGKPWWQQ